MIGLLVAAALGADVDSASSEGEILDALAAEMKRDVADLSLADAPPIYHLRYRLLALNQVTVEASSGSLISVDTGKANALGVELRVGTPGYDNTGFGGWEDGFQVAGLPRDLTAHGVRLQAWESTDAAYKQAVEQYARKTAQFTPPVDYPGDYTLTGPVAFDDGAGAPADAAALADLATKVSAALAASDLVQGEVYVGQESGSAWLLDTEGSRARLPVEECTIRATAELRAPDGMILTDQRLWTVSKPSDLPPVDAMVAEVGAMRIALEALAAAPTLDEEYVGPVVFEEGAAVDLYRYLLTGQIEGTPEEVPFDSFFGELGLAKDAVRMGRRVLPMGWSATDDPTAGEGPGGFTHDWEGTPARAVDVVEDGIAKTLLMSRVPRNGLRETNGHARGYLGLRAEGRVSRLAVTPDHHESAAKLQKMALKVARSYGRDWYVAVRRLQEPSVLSAIPGTDDPFGEDGVALPPPVELVRVHADGREELVRGASFAGVERWMLRDLVAAGPQVEAAYLAPIYGNEWWMLAPTEGLPTWISAPAVLVGEAELVPSPGDPQDTPIVPPPAD